MLLGGRVGGCCSAVLHAAAADPLQLFTYYLDGHQDSPSTGGDHDTIYCTGFKCFRGHTFSRFRR